MLPPIVTVVIPCFNAAQMPRNSTMFPELAVPGFRPGLMGHPAT
jgi:hypothetical protein